MLSSDQILGRVTEAFFPSLEVSESKREKEKEKKIKRREDKSGREEERRKRW